VLLLVSHAFQQYVDVTVAGVARATLERLLARDLQGHGLIYEYAVAGIRTRRPLVISVRVLQTMTGLVVSLVIAVGVYVAVQGQPWYIEVGFGVGTGFGSVSAALSYWDMLRSGRIARDRIELALVSHRTTLTRAAKVGPSHRTPLWAKARAGRSHATTCVAWVHKAAGARAVPYVGLFPLAMDLTRRPSNSW